MLKEPQLGLFQAHGSEPSAAEVERSPGCFHPRRRARRLREPDFLAQPLSLSLVETDHAGSPMVDSRESGGAIPSVRWERSSEVALPPPGLYKLRNMLGWRRRRPRQRRLCLRQMLDCKTL